MAGPQSYLEPKAGSPFFLVGEEKRGLEPAVPEQGIFIHFFHYCWVQARARARRTVWLDVCPADWNGGTLKYPRLDVATGTNTYLGLKSLISI